MNDQTDGPEPYDTAEPHVRQEFYRAFHDRAEEFLTDTLALVPELQGLALVPVWRLQQPSLPVMLAQGADETAASQVDPAWWLRLSLQLAEAQLVAASKTTEILMHVDQRMGDMARELQQLAALRQELMGGQESSDEPPAAAD